MYFSGGLIPTYLVVKQLGLMGSPWVVILLGSVSVYNIIIARSFFTNNIPPEVNFKIVRREVRVKQSDKFFFPVALI